MRRLWYLGLILMLFLITGCGKYDDKEVMKDLTKRYDNPKGYYLEGDMEIINNEDVYKYNVKASYQNPDFFKVSLKNIANNHEQIILKNEDGVYVLTPSLNKSFKFQSEWPYNNSQVYLIQTLLRDLKNDDKKVFEETENYYVFTTKVNYPNNRKLTKQVIYLDKDLNFKEVHVLNENNNPEIKMMITKTDIKATFKDKYFTLNENMATAMMEESITPVMKIEDVVYPMYIPENTYLNSQDPITKTIGERVILTFDGEKPFILVEETASIEEEFTIIPTYGEPMIIVDTIGAVSDNSVLWNNHGMEYYLASEVMGSQELLEVASSISVLPVIK